jgi:hypothetical protein
VSNPESFIDEVTEEVRRDRLFALFRKWGWVAGLAVVLVVGGTAWNEWQKSRAEARAEAFGNAVIDAMDVGGTEERRAALSAVPATGEQAAILQLLLASDPAEDGAETLAALDRVAADPALSPIYRDLAVLRRVLVAGTSQPVAERKAALEPVAAAGRPYRGLALEQLALLLVEEGKTDEAIAAFQALRQDRDASEGTRARAAQMIVALGGTVGVEG